MVVIGPYGCSAEQQASDSDGKKRGEAPGVGDLPEVIPEPSG